MRAVWSIHRTVYTLQNILHEMFSGTVARTLTWQLITPYNCELLEAKVGNVCTLKIVTLLSKCSFLMLALHYLHIGFFPRPSQVCSCLSSVSYPADEPSASGDTRYVHWGRESKHESPPSRKKRLPPKASSNLTALTYTESKSNLSVVETVGWLVWFFQSLF